MPTEEGADQPPDSPNPSSVPSPISNPIVTKSDYQEKSYRLNQRQFVIAIITLVVLATYTAIAGYQAKQMRLATIAATQSAIAAKTAADAAAEASELANRPRIKILQGPEQQDTIVKTRFLTTAIDASNWGPYDAKNVHFYRYENVSTRDAIKPMPYEERKN